MQTAFDAWVLNAIADIVVTQNQYLRGLAGERLLTFTPMLVSTTANFRVVGCQAQIYSKKQALARFSGLSADCGTVFH